MQRCHPAILPSRALALALAFAPLFAHGALLAEPPAAQVTVDEVVCRYSAASADCPDAGQAPAAAAEPVTRAFSFQRPGQGQAITGQPAASAATATAPPRPSARPVFKPKPSPGVSRNDLLVSFENNSFELTAQAKVNIAVFARALLTPQLAGRRFEIAGHTNATGPRDYNLELSQRRAEAVADFLQSQGVALTRLVLHGYGFDRPLAETAPAEPRNRRVEANLLPAE